MTGPGHGRAGTAYLGGLAFGETWLPIPAGGADVSLEDPLLGPIGAAPAVGSGLLCYRTRGTKTKASIIPSETEMTAVMM